MPSDLTTLRHSAEHVLHQAVKDLYPQIHLAMGPATEDGFYFDFDSSPDGAEPVTVTQADFPQIEKRMRELIALNLPFTKHEISAKEARGLFKDNPYKLEWIDDIVKNGQQITIYWTGQPGKPHSMVDLCSGPHLDSTGQIRAFKLLSVAGAYWHGDEKNKMLTRIYGTAFPSQAELDQHLSRLEEAKKRDHRKLGKDLDLFVFSDLVGKGLPLWTEKGALIYRQIERYVIDTEIAAGYSHVLTPNIAKTDLYKTSGHYPYYKDTMYPPMKIDEDELILRPMTCPHHFALYMSKARSYRELPLRYAEMASLYRYEKSGELTGLIRVREFCLADSHNFVAKDQAYAEINRVLDLIETISATFGLEKGVNYRYRLSLGNRENKEKYYDAPKEWDSAENVLRQVISDRQAPHYEAPDEAAFYGPKIDIQMTNVNGKEDTAFTVQYDFCLPQRFRLRYTNARGEEEQPIVIHRSSFGAMERSIGFLIEHFSGAFPVWLSPIQAIVLPLGEKHVVYAKLLTEQLKQAGLRVDLRDQADSLGKRIRQGEKHKIPYMLVVGDKEVASNTLSLRTRGKKAQDNLTAVDFIARITNRISTKSLDL